MRHAIAGTLLLLMSLSANQAAATPIDVAPWSPAPVDAAALDSMCNPRGGVPWAFGTKGVPYSSRIENNLGIRQSLNKSVGPFREMQPTATPWSDQLFEFAYSAPMSRPDATIHMENIARLAAQQGWVKLNPDTLPMYLMSYGGEYGFEKPGGADGRMPAIMLGIDYAFGRLSLTCGHKSLTRTNAEEALGKLPAGSPRPLRPEIAFPPPVDPAECAKPDVRKTQLAIIDGDMNLMMAAAMRRADYNERLTTWKRWKIETSGKTSSARLNAIAMAGLKAGSPGGDPLAAFRSLSGFMDAIIDIAKKHDAGDDVAACQAVIRSAKLLDGMEAIGAGQWRAMNTALEAEAKQVGVSLD